MSTKKIADPVEVAQFDLEQAERPDLEAFYELWMTARAVDRPEDDVAYSFDEWVAAARQPSAGLGTRAIWVARDAGRIVASAIVSYLEEENSGVALTDITVSPELRRNGVGTATLRAVLPELEAQGRTVVEGWDLTEGGAGHKWADAVEMHTAKATVIQLLKFADVDPATWEVPVPTGYRLESWVDATPGDLVASYANALSAMRDAPAGTSSVQQPEWTVERVRASETETRETGVERRVVAAVCESTGEVVGLTRMDIYSTAPTWGHQLDTVVEPSHRGHGLGLCIKAHMARLLRAERSEVDRVYTGTNADNDHMIRINHRMGFTTARRTVGVNATIAELRVALGV
ncbi:GNAT family N-acetyltransferase [Lentzea sp. NPDC058436]|uniref:GNAT family N-acetyltransferase n=1 Tax=Lentzea sp. NPDC058436 TaxID=3346499 RepID=UPI003669BA45